MSSSLKVALKSVENQKHAEFFKRNFYTSVNKRAFLTKMEKNTYDVQYPHSNGYGSFEPFILHGYRKYLFIQFIDGPLIALVIKLFLKKCEA